jgi:hypothetical protein
MMRGFSGGTTHAGSILASFSDELPLTNSLLINRPVDKAIFLPFGAVNSISAIMLKIGIIYFMESNRESCERSSHLKTLISACRDAGTYPYCCGHLALSHTGRWGCKWRMRVNNSLCNIDCAVLFLSWKWLTKSGMRILDCLNKQAGLIEASVATL